MVNDYNTSKEGPFLQLFAIWTESGSGKVEKRCREHYGLSELDNYELILKIIEDYHLCRRHENLSHCYNAATVKKAVEAGKNIAMLAIEGCGAIDSLEKLNEVYNLGTRFVTLTWNPDNCIAHGCDASWTDRDTGLTDFGKEFVKECGRLGIAVDLSHASNKTMTDVLELDCAPVFASHSNFRAVCNHRRNLPDEVALGICAKGGFIGLNTYLPFVKEGVGYPDYHANELVRHAEYADKLGIIDHLGFGFDLDGIDGYAVEIDGSRSIHDQYIKVFEDEGITGDRLEDIFGNNFLKFIERKF